MTKSKEVKETPDKKVSLKVETLFPREEIMRNASAFGVDDYTLIGAMAEMNEKEYSRSQILAAIEKFKKRKVKQK